MADYRFRSMQALRADPSLRLDQDYRFVVTPRPSPGAVIAPHGGKIEPSTHEIAEAVAGDKYRLFSFVGMMKNGNKYNLHVESHLYETDSTRLAAHESCLTLLSGCQRVVAIHGAANADYEAAKPPAAEYAGYDRAIYVGGLDEDLKIEIFNRLIDIRDKLWVERNVGEQVRLFYIAADQEIGQIRSRLAPTELKPGIVEVVGYSHHRIATCRNNRTKQVAFRGYGGREVTNICNLGASGRVSNVEPWGKGAQLEISRTVRDELAPNLTADGPAHFVKAIQGALERFVP